MEEETSSLKYAALNGMIRSSRVQYSAYESHKKKQSAEHQQPMRIAQDFLMLGFSSTKTFTFCIMPSTPVILRRAEGEVAESIIQHNPRHPGERGPSKTMVEGQTKTLFLTPHPP